MTTWGIIVTIDGTIKSETTMAKSLALPGASRRAKAKPTIALVVTVKVANIVARKVEFQV